MKVGFKRTTPNYRSSLSTTRIMAELSAALLIVFGFALYYQFSQAAELGIRAILIMIVSIVSAYVTEVLFFLLRKEKDFKKAIRQSFPLVTAIILALILPIGTPLFVVAFGSITAILFGKLIYGGFGQNIFNPALVGRAMVMLSYGGLITTVVKGLDITTGATPTTMLASGNWVVSPNQSLFNLFLGFYQGSIGETFTIVILILGVILAIRKILDWRIPVFYLGTAFIISVVVALTQGLNPLTFALTQIAIGGLAFGAIFMATDPVTSPTSLNGKVIFAVGAGFLTMLIRFKASLPEGVMFAILIMNMLTPMIERYTVSPSNQNIMKKWIFICGTLLVSIAIMIPASNAAFGISFPGFKRQTVETVKKWCSDQQQVDFNITCTFTPDSSDLATIAENPVAAQTLLKRGTELKFTTNPAPVLAKVIGSQNGGILVETAGYAPTPMKVLVFLDQEAKRVIKVEVIEHDESEEYGKDLIAGTLAKGKAFSQKVFQDGFGFEEKLDTTTGATKTARGIASAVQAAIDFVSNTTVVSVNGNQATITAEGFHGDVTATVTVENGKAVKVDVTSHEETPAYGEALMNGETPQGGADAKAKAFFDTIFGGQSDITTVQSVDINTGATFTAGALQAIVARAIIAVGK